MRLGLTSKGVSLVAIALLAAAACGPGQQANSSPGKVDVLATWTGPEQAAFMAVLKPFEDQTGIKVEYEVNRDFDAALTTRIAANNPPDIAADPGPSLPNKLAKEGKLVALDSVLDMSAFKAQYSKGWIDLGTVNGHLYQIYPWVSLKGLVWYNPKNFAAKGYAVPKTWQDLLALQDQIKSGGTAPWCIGLEFGAASGWPGSDWVKEIVLSQSGPNVYDNWWQGKQKWTSPEIKQAWQTWGAAILGSNDSNVYGGSKYMIATYAGNGGDQLFAKPPKCYLHNQGSFITSFFTKADPSLQPGTDFTFFALPDVSNQFSGSRVVSGDGFGMYKDTPQARKLMQYLATAEAQAIWVKSGGKISSNNKTSLADYPDDLSRATAQVVVGAKIAKFDAGDLMPSDMRTAYWKAVLDFVQDQSRLDSILQSLDKVQATAYTA